MKKYESHVVKTLQHIYHSKGPEKARKRLFRAFEKNRMADQEFVNLSMLLGRLITGEGVMVCDIKNKGPKPKHI